MPNQTCKAVPGYLFTCNVLNSVHALYLLTVHKRKTYQAELSLTLVIISLFASSYLSLGLIASLPYFSHIPLANMMCECPVFLKIKGSEAFAKVEKKASPSQSGLKLLKQDHRLTRLLQFVQKEAIASGRNLCLGNDRTVKSVK